MADEPVVEVKGAAKAFTLPTGEHLRVLSGIDLTVHAGESVAVRGRSGAGKSTLLRALGLFTAFDAGEHRLLGVDVRRSGDRRCSELRARSIGFVFQDFRLLPSLTAAQNVEYAAVLAGIRLRQCGSAARAVLDEVGLADRHRSRPSQLSGGEQQRVGIARALVKRPALVLADEPTGALDADTAESIIDLLLGAVTELGAGLVIVTHDDAVAERCDRRVYLEHGSISEARPALAGSDAR